VKTCIDAAKGRAPVVAGAGSNNTEEAVGLVKFAEEAGADAVLVVTPYYNKPTQRGLYEHFAAVARATKLPIVIYNIPPRSVIDMSPETMGRLAHDFDNIVGVKDATGKVERVSEQRMTCGKDFIQLSGEDASALGFNAHGGVGCISVTANVAPRLCADMHAAWAKGDVKTAMRLNERLMPVHEALFAETSPAPVKFAASLLGKARETCRLPIAELLPETKERVRREMRAAGLLE
jgi:4-hydroxy-tetrahydrodipicolinate synthase